VCYSTKLEKLQLDAARIVTGLPIFTKTDKLYSETELLSLVEDIIGNSSYIII
jgi:hypothetical protein